MSDNEPVRLAISRTEPVLRFYIFDSGPAESARTAVFLLPLF